MITRLAFSVSTILRANILLKDEWFTVGDDIFQSQAGTRIKHRPQDSTILTIASHPRDLQVKTCQRVIWLIQGKVKLDTATDKVVSMYFG
jgi:lipopolysaccharide transport system ATP-binding protein